MVLKAEPGNAALRQRDLAVDGLRTLAVLLMISSHTSRLILWDVRPPWCRFVLLIEPLTASLFLILVGASLVHSWQAIGMAKRTHWYRKQSIRALALWLLSGIFYSLEEGFHWPDAVFASGILATIAYSILAGMFLVSLRRSTHGLLFMAVALAALQWFLDEKQIRWFLINSGNSPLLPLFLFVCLGALGTLVVKSPNRWLRGALVTGGLLVLTLIFHRHSFEEVFSKPYGRYETARTVVTGSGTGRVERSIPYYNLRPALVPVIASLTLLLYALLAVMSPMLNKTARFIFPMGRHSLDVYILHLALLAVLVLKGGLRPLHTTALGNGVFITVVAICYAWALGRDLYRERRIKVLA